jgi:DNA-damage-inducible protein J
MAGKAKKTGRPREPKTGMIRARVDPRLKAKVEGILGQLGLSASDAIRIFYTQVALTNGMPFEVRVPNALTRRTLEDADAGKNLTRYASVDEMFKDMDL